MSNYQKKHKYAENTIDKKFTKKSLAIMLEEQEDATIEALIERDKALEEVEKYKKLYQEAVEAQSRGENVLLTKEETIKKVLEMRAKNYAPAIISDKLRYIGVEVTVQTVKDIVYSELSPELELYYNKCKDAFKEAIKLNTDELKQSNITEIQALIDSCYEDLNNASDLKERSDLRKELKELLKLRSDVTKNIDDYESIDEEEDELLNETMSETEEVGNQVFNLKQITDVKISKVGD